MALRDMIPWRNRGRDLAHRGSEQQYPLEAFRREVDRLFNRFWDDLGQPAASSWPFAATFPRVDATEDDKAIHVTAELPGLQADDIEVTLAGGVLTISGEKKEEKEDKAESRYLRERAYGSFRRAIPLAVEVDEDRIEASFENGVLRIDIPKSEEARKRMKKIEVKAR